MHIKGIGRGFVAASLTLAGCTTPDKIHAYYDNRPEISPDKLSDFSASQNRIVTTLLQFASANKQTVPLPAKDGTEDWSPLTRAGIYYVDVRCERYLDALFWMGRTKDGVDREISYAGAATAATLALVSASKELLGITPLGFTLASQSVDNLGKSLLFDLPASTIKQLVSKQQEEYKSQIKDSTYSTPLVALQAVQGYVSLCLPDSIEAEVNVAVSKAHFTKTKNGAATTTPPPTAPAPAVVTPGSSPPVAPKDVIPTMSQDQTHD